MEQNGLNMVVMVVDPKTNQVIRRHEADYGRSSSRNWLRRLEVWALTNDYIVETFSKKLDEEYKLSKEYYLTMAKALPK